MRVLAPGTWINSTGFDVVLRMASPMDATRLQPQVELRRADRPFTGQATISGAVVSYSGSPVLGIVRVRGLRDGVSYHWQARVRDTLGPGSAWVPLNGPTGATLRVYLARPSAPALALVTPAQPGGWVATRRLTLRWSAPPDGSGIRGYAYTLSRNPRAAPLTHLRTESTSVTVPAHGDGLWYFTVRALNNAHSWGPPAHLAVRIDTRTPRLHVLAAPSGPVNPARTQPLLLLGLNDWSRVTVDVLTTDGRVLRSISTHLHGPGDRLAINWDGLDSHGTRAVTGRYLLRISAANRAGMTWNTNRPLDVESAPPAFASYGFALPWTYNPYNNGLDGVEVITTTVSEPASVRIEALYNGHVLRAWALQEKRAGDVLNVNWDGTSGKSSAFLPEGLYTFRASAVDTAGNRATLDLGSVSLDLRRIVISLDAQQLWALDGSSVLLTTLVTTGGPELPTPTGDYQIIDRESPFTFRSMDPPGSPFWYPPSPTNFALLFQVNGYFIHDAPWRSYYGPGSNAIDGKPGSNTTGSHGCVNVPYTPMSWLYGWATMYTPVQVRQHVVPGQW